ncbi:CMD domain protein, partial [uncultured Microbacterium sp.]|uniref:CMD domain protein n=1 Tax=uncultured Microbacterium sp. TaxID=191216 RepID=UPI0025DC29A0
GPYGAYREPQLAGDSTAGPRWTAREVDAAASGALGPRLAAALAHTHLLVFRPREARADALRALVAASWSADDIVSLSQLVAFLAFQLRLAWGLRVLAAAGPADAEASALSTEGAIR